MDQEAVASEAVLSLLKSVNFHPEVTDEHLSRLTAESRIIQYQSGDTVYSQGDIADAAYVIVSGTIEIIAPGASGSGIVLERLSVGALFGEPSNLGLFYLPRSKTARAMSEACLLRMAYSAFPRPVANGTSGSDHPPARPARPGPTTMQTALQGTLLAQQFPPETFAGVACSCRQYRSGEVVFRQGDKADDVFIVEAGAAQIFLEEPTGLRLIASVEPGGFFGEKGVLSGEPRAATVIARNLLQVLVLNGASFREEVRCSPQAQAFFSALDDVYHLPRRGLVMQAQSVLDGIPAVTSSYSLLDGRIVLVAKALSTDVVIFRQSPLPQAMQWVVSNAAPGVRIGLEGDRLAAIESPKYWPGLEGAAMMMLDGIPVERWCRTLFESTGTFRIELPQETGLDTEVICGCMGLTRRELTSHLSCAADADALSAATGAGTVCGGCRPRLIELAGRRGMFPVRITARHQLATEIDSFLLVGTEASLPKAAPGQHIVLEGLIDGNWVRRSFTLTGLEGGEAGLEIAVSREDRGLFSNWLFTNATAGQASTGLLRASAPAGESRFDGFQRPIVFIAAGIGITPAVALARGIASESLPRMGLTILHSVRGQEYAAYHDELEQGAGQGHFEYLLWLSRARGHVGEEAVATLVARKPNAVFWICGPESFERAMSNHLIGCGVSCSDVFVERFLTSAVAPRQDCPVLPKLSQTGPAVAPVRLEDWVSEAEQARKLVMQIHAENRIPQEVTAARIKTISRKQPFEPSGEELGYAAKLAWRNANRCIGRLYWKGLIVRDRRRVAEAEEILDEMIEHMDVATNEGRLRSAITIFAPLTDHPPVILSPQLIRYAGYRQQDGGIIGDPAHLDLTETAIGLGWRGAGTAFDILPLLVKDGSGQIHMRKLDPARILEVPLSHPDFPWFAELGLRWHALPAISNLCLDAFGRLYPVVISGWYMETEIGARNLSDVYRYNLLPKVARRMGLSCKDDTNLWKDRALVELNRAVLHSFRRVGVTIIDHHSASREFFEFIGQEHACGRVANAEWSWVVPPISGSATPQFHVNFSDVKLRPAFVPRPAEPSPATQRGS